MKKMNTNIFLFVDPVAGVLTCPWKQNNRNGYENRSQPKTTYLMFGRNVSTNFIWLKWGFFLKHNCCHGNYQFDVFMLMVPKLGILQNSLFKILKR